MQLAGATIESTSGDEIGEIDKIVQSNADGRYFAVVDMGGFLGVGEQRKAVPINELYYDAQRNRSSFETEDQTEDELEALPAYNEAQ